ncbi:30S ribosomal protein S7 [Patescibacteria group bacterium]|nr:30S ribosomal protein S7 [Patescibacteria group bacterium]
MRRKLKTKKPLSPDNVYDSTKVAKFINYIMIGGKKNTARKIVYDALEIIKEKEAKDKPVEVFDNALKNVGPTMEVRSRRIGGAAYQVPREVRPERRMALAMRWIIEIAKKGKGKPMANRLADELLLANKNEGEAVKKRENVHKMADANKAFAHFSW